jgi:hypothetical protein
MNRQQRRAALKRAQSKRKPPEPTIGESPMAELHVVFQTDDIDKTHKLLNELHNAGLIGDFRIKGPDPLEMVIDNVRMPQPVSDDVTNCIDCDQQFSVAVMTTVQHPNSAPFFMCQGCWKRMVDLALKGAQSEQPQDGVKTGAKADVMGSVVTVKGPTNG